MDDPERCAAYLRQQMNYPKQIIELREQLEQVTKERDAARTENERLNAQLRDWQEEKDAKAGYL